LTQVALNLVREASCEVFRLLSSIVKGVMQPTKSVLRGQLILVKKGFCFVFHAKNTCNWNLRLLLWAPGLNWEMYQYLSFLLKCPSTVVLKNCKILKCHRNLGSRPIFHKQNQGRNHMQQYDSVAITAILSIETIQSMLK